MQPAVGPSNKALEVARRFNFTGKSIELNEVGRCPLVEIVESLRFFEGWTISSIFIVVSEQRREFIPVGLFSGNETVEIEDHVTEYG